MAKTPMTSDDHSDRAHYVRKDGRFTIEDRLPYPAVDYWKLYATFLGFAPTPSEPYSLCECSLPALANAISLEKRFLDLRQFEGETERRLPMWATDVKFSYLPGEASEASLKFRTLPNACHRCNMETPTYSYCSPMYGGTFKQKFGWYISQNHLKFGVRPTSLLWLPELAPPEVAALLHDVPTEISRPNHEVPDRLKRQIANFFENYTRKEFGFTPIGEGWIGESLLAKLTAQVFPESEIVRHFRPPWLEGLELDIWLPSKRIGIEYQGQQHYKPIKAWGGEQALAALQIRDARKVAICKSLGVRLLVFEFTEPLTANHLETRLSSLDATDS